MRTRASLFSLALVATGCAAGSGTAPEDDGSTDDEDGTDGQVDGSEGDEPAPAPIEIPDARNPGTIWLFEVSEGTTTNDPTVCAENFLTYVCDNNGAEGGSFTTTNDSDRNNGLRFAQVVPAAEAGKGFLLWQGEVFPGTLTGDTWTFEFTDFSSSESKTEHSSMTYFYSRKTENTFKTTVTLTVSGTTATGTIVVMQTQKGTYRETDEWVFNTVGRSYSSINEFGNNTDGSNSYTTDDCTGDVCELTLTSTSSTTWSITATLTDAGENLFDDVDGYDQNGNGVGG